MAYVVNVAHKLVATVVVFLVATTTPGNRIDFAVSPNLRTFPGA
jgi:hypothetical protein